MFYNDLAESQQDWCRHNRHGERSEAIQNVSAEAVWIASSLRASQ
jgi:hypothetical protein